MAQCVEYKGKMYTFSQLVEFAAPGIGVQAIRDRIRRQGLSVEEALTKPLDKRRYKRHKLPPCGVTDPYDCQYCKFPNDCPYLSFSIPGEGNYSHLFRTEGFDDYGRKKKRH